MCHSKRTEMCQLYLYKIVLRSLLPLIAFIKEIVDPSLNNSYLPQYKLKSNPVEDLSDADVSWHTKFKNDDSTFKTTSYHGFFRLPPLSLSLYFSPSSPFPSRLSVFLNCFVLQCNLLSIVFPRTINHHNVK